LYYYTKFGFTLHRLARNYRIKQQCIGSSPRPAQAPASLSSFNAHGFIQFLLAPDGSKSRRRLHNQFQTSKTVRLWKRKTLAKPLAM
jgi:hypothetical protein